MCERTPRRCEDGTLAIGTNDQPAYWSDNGDLGTSPGLLDRVRTALQHSGRQVIVDDRRQFAHPFVPRATIAVDAGFEQRRLLESVTSSPRGQLLLHRGVDKTVLQLHEHFPFTRTLLVVSSRTKAAELQRRLERNVLEPIQLLSGVKQARSRLCITTTQHFAQGVNFTVDMRWGLVLFLGADAATSVAGLRNWEYPTYARKYVLHSRPAMPFNQRLLLELVAGPVIYRQPRHGLPTPRVIVERIEPPSSPESGRIHDPLERKRRLLWSNLARNRFIAALAMAYEAADLRKVQSLNLALDERPTDWTSYEGRLDTVVVVENVAHARELQRLLPGWKLCMNEPVAPSASRRSGAWEHYAQSRAIVTFAWMQRWGLAAEVVIRADGTATRWDEKWAVHPDVVRRAGVVRLVDVYDEFDDEARTAARARWTAYQNYDWVDRDAASPVQHHTA